MAVAVADITEAVAALYIARYCATACDTELDIKANIIGMMYEVKYHHDITEELFLSTVVRSIERAKQAYPLTAMHMEEAEYKYFVYSELRYIYEGV